MQHVSGGRDVNIELNALKEFEREFLKDLLRDAIEQYVDADQREATADRVEERQKAIKEAISVDYSAVEDV
jgi:cation transport regulator ChaB